MSQVSLLDRPAVSAGTASASEQGKSFQNRLPAAGHLRVALGSGGDAELAAVLAQAKAAIRSGVRDLEPTQAASLIKQVTRLLDPIDWDDDDEIMKVASLRTLIRLVIALRRAVGLLTLTRKGNLVATWVLDNETLRVEVLTNGRISWAHVKKGADVTEPTHRVSDSIAGLQAFLGW